VNGAQTLLEAIVVGRDGRQLADRLPVAPLLDGHATVNDAARHLQVHPRQVHRWQHNGLTVNEADRVAVRLGVHPSAIWPDWWTVGVRACGCGNPITDIGAYRHDRCSDCNANERTT